MENRNKKWLLFAGVALFALAFTFMRGVQSRPAALDETATYSELSQLDDAAVNTIDDADSDESATRDGHRHGRHGHRHGHGLLHMLFKILHIVFIVLGVLFIIKMIRRGRREERRRGRRRRGGRGRGPGRRRPGGGRRHASWTNDEDEIEVDIDIEVSEDDEADE